MAVTGVTERLRPPEDLCPKCGGRLEIGFVPDMTDTTRGQRQMWISGHPEPNFWTGLRMRNRPSFYLETLRCGQCGLLEFYARQPVHEPPESERE